MFTVHATKKLLDRVTQRRRPEDVLELGAPWADYPSDDVEADTRRMNAWLEGVVRTMPEQYYWVHRRFKTRPEGEPRIY